jgi:DNA-binding LytR/AlgR family response regulator
MRRYRYGSWVQGNNIVWNNLDDSWWKRQQDIMNLALNTMGGQEINLANQEVATITLKKDGRIYKVKIQDITDLEAKKDEIISIKLESLDETEDSTSEDTEQDDVNGYYTE